MSCPKVVFTKVVDELTHYFLQHVGKSKRFESKHCMIDIIDNMSIRYTSL